MEAHSFNWVDYSIVSIIVLSMLISLARGFVREALSLITWIAAIWIGIHFTTLVSQWLLPYISATPIRMGVAFFLLFAVALLIGSIISFIVVQFIQKTGLSGTDRSLGVVFGLGRGFIVVSVGLLIANMMFPPSHHVIEKDEHAVKAVSALQQSRLAPEFQPIMDWLREFLPETPSPAQLVNLPGLSE